jgi:hypothetical protein
MARKPKCKHREHDWQPMKRGGAREQCTKCQDVFPCRHACEHLDCCAATGREMPEWCCDPVQAREAMLAELAIIAPTVFAAIQKPKRVKRAKRELQEAA